MLKHFIKKHSNISSYINIPAHLTLYKKALGVADI